MFLPIPVPGANTLLRNCLVIFTVLVALAAAMTSWCPVSCICNDQLVVHCSGQGLADVPLDLPLATRQLLLSDNKITELPTVQLNYLSDLVYLDCSNNSLYHLSKTTFINLKKLAYLDLSFNKLVQVDDRMFVALASLVVLRLTDNPGLDQMHVDAFAENSALQVLDISRNNLTLLNITTLITLPALRSIGVSGNPWECECSNEDLCLWMQVEDYKFQDDESTLCRGPAPLSGMRLSELGLKLRVDCHQGLDSWDYLFLLTVGFLIFSGGTVSAWVMGVVMLLYERWENKQENEEGDEEEGSGGEKQGNGDLNKPIQQV
ncbi:leucine-rich repeat-containing protein 52-like [Acipenser oxyrinchus oxyrinchus]|uniref:Leucine-rich repeat-containing protein 52-like n=1 Tax=Acipenser oxyrinchus oxyrinchus TaxID=40147 RepID=A0AAD8D7H8_ACIOX|nr:leucine-rich repeat-containing protein 52-like [Acipenser oxyrinchus oxyrinchus]